jgi:hypothetical protein
MLAMIIALVWLAVAGIFNYADHKIGDEPLFNGFSPVWLIWPVMLTAFLTALLYEATTGEKLPWHGDDDE